MVWPEGDRDRFLSAPPAADRRNLVSVPNPAHHLGHTRNLLFESAVGHAAVGVSRNVCSIRRLGLLDHAATEHVRGFSRIVCRRGRLVDLHLSLTSSPLATGSRGDATGDHRW